MTDFFSTRFAAEPLDAPEPRASFVADLRQRLESEWSDESEELDMVMTQERPTEQSPAGPSRPRWGRYALAAAAAAVLAVVVGVALANRDDDATRVVNEPSTTTTTAAPRTVGAMDKRLIADGSPIAMVGTDTGLWNLANGDLQRMDPVTGVRTSVLRVADARADSVDDAIIPADGSLFVALHGSGIVEVAADGSSVLHRYDLPTLGAYRGLSVAVSADALWATVDGGAAIVRVDRGSGQVSAPATVGTDEFRKLAFDGTWLYATMYKGAGTEVLRKLDPTTLAVQAETSLPVYLSRGVLLADGTLWVSGDVDSRGVAAVVAVDLASMKVRARATPAGRYGQAMVERDGTIWVGMHESDSLTGIDAGTGAVTATIPFENKAEGAENLALAPDGSMWAWEPPIGTLLRFTFTE